MEQNVFQILRRRYPESEYALMEEVSDRAGHNRSNSADYIVMSLWPSRGLSLQGFELKSYRGDWLRELKKPKKAENIFQYCDCFWLLTADEDVAKLEEIPKPWGWLSIKGQRIIVKKPAPQLKPKPVTKDFLACMLKRAASKGNYVRYDEIDERIEHAREEGKSQADRSRGHIQEEYEKLKNTVEEFQKHSGINLQHTWHGDTKDIGQAIKFINNGGADSIRKQLLGLKETTKTVSERIENGLKSLETIPEKENS